MFACNKFDCECAFYKRKLWTFNFTFRNITSKRTACMLRHVGLAQREADEVASCLFQVFKELPNDVKKRNLYSSACPGQNRNNTFPVMFIITLSKKTIKEINHKFHFPGNPHLLLPSKDL